MFDELICTFEFTLNGYKLFLVLLNTPFHMIKILSHRLLFSNAIK